MEKKYNFVYQTKNLIKYLYNNTSGIYKITSPSGRVYIGQSVNIYKRWLTYKRVCPKNQKLLTKSLLKYGFENHHFEVIELCNKEELNEREIYWIDFYKTNVSVNKKNKGLNLTSGGQGMSEFKHSEETKIKLSKALKGRSVSLETRRKQSESLKGINKGNKYWLGRKHTEETKAKISKNKKVTAKRGSDTNTAVMLFNTITGIYYDTIKEASESCNMKLGTLCSNTSLTNGRKNYTDFIRV